MGSFSNIPNIGKTLEQKLKQAEINSIQDLKVIGSENALLRIRAFDQTACFSMLCALEGAIQGIRWHHLPEERKNELKHFLMKNDISIT